MFPIPSVINLKQIRMIKTAKNKSVKCSWWDEPRVELLNDWDVVVDYVLTNDCLSTFQHRDGTSDRFLSTFIVEDINLIVTNVFDSNTVDGGKVVVQAVSFDVEEEIHLNSFFRSSL